MEVLDRILMLLKENNMQQKDLAKAIGLSSNALTGWKNGNNSSYIKHLPKIAEFLNVSVDYLLGKETESTNENDFTYALYDEITHDLSKEQIEQIIKFADFLRNS